MLWTDGSASPNPGPGGFAVIMDGQPVALGKELKTTNIRMEARALIAALEYAKEHQPQEYKIITDSEFWINVLTKWAPTWKANGWKKKSGAIKNLDLVQNIYEKWINRAEGTQLEWTRGHAGTEMNELADRWANKARKGETL